MAIVPLQFACAHPVQAVDVDKTPQPACAVCGTRKVRHAQIGPPRFTGVATGPHVTHMNLPALAVTVGLPSEKESA